MKRSELYEIIREAAELAGCTPLETYLLLTVPYRVNRVAVGAWYNDEMDCGCPATVVGLTRPPEPHEIPDEPQPVTRTVHLFTCYFDSSFSNEHEDEPKPVAPEDSHGNEYIILEDG